MYEAMKDLAIGCGCVLVAYILKLGTDRYCNSVGDSIGHGKMYYVADCLASLTIFHG